MCGADQVVATATHANARSFYAFSRDKGMPDRGFFYKLARNQIPINAVWLVLFISGASDTACRLEEF